MKCPRCSAEIPPQSKFCLRCGTPVNATTEIPAFTPPSSPSVPLRGASGGSGRGVWIALGVVALVALGLGAMVVKGQLTQKAGQTTNGTLVQAPGEANTGTLVQKPGETVKTPIVQAPAPAAASTADIEDYLAFLKGIEVTKQRLQGDELGKILPLLTQAKGLSGSIDADNYNKTLGNIGTGTSDISREWDTLAAKFQQKTPPASCMDLANKYYDQLGKIQGSLVKLMDGLSKLSTDPNGALAAIAPMSGAASAEIDDSIRKADNALADVCDKYHLRKDFDIRSDSSSAGLFR